MDKEFERQFELALIGQKIADFLADLSENFKDPVCLTLLVRNQKDLTGKRDLMLSNDKFEEIVTALKRFYTDDTTHKGNLIGEVNSGKR